MAERVNATQARRRFVELLNRVHSAGDSFVIVHNGEEVGILAPLARCKPAKRTLGELFTALCELPPPDPEFAEDLAEIQANQTPLEEGPWG